MLARARTGSNPVLEGSVHVNFAMDIKLFLFLLFSDANMTMYFKTNDSTDINEELHTTIFICT